jgi:ABC-2 type transport system permease protein
MNVAKQPLYWSIRREVWENRSLYIVPLVTASLNLFVFLATSYHFVERRSATLLLDLAHQRKRIGMPYDLVAVMLIFVPMIVAFFYCIDALHNERRDRSILFWKSLPVSDLTTVLSKASIPLFVLPLISFVIILATQLIMLFYSNLLLLIHGIALTTSSQLPLFENSLILLYGLIVIALWHAPIYGWLLLISGWGRRAQVLWVVLPPLAIAAVERAVANGTHFVELVQYRTVGFLQIAFEFKGGEIDKLAQLTPLKFLTTPGLWIGLVFAALFIGAAVRMRRNREPI